MEALKLRIKSVCREKNIPVSNMLMAAGIQSGDYYLAVNGKKPFYPGWRKRIAQVLEKEEYDLFLEYVDNTKGV